MARVTHKIRPLVRAAILALALLPVDTLYGVEQIQLELGKLHGAGWRLDEPQAAIQFGKEGLEFSARIEALTSANGEVWLKDIRLHCDEPVLNATYLVCVQGSAEFFVVPAGIGLTSTLDFVLRRSDGKWRATGLIAFERGRLAWRIQGGEAGIQISANSEQLSLAALLPWVKPTFPQLAALSGQLQALAFNMRLPAERPIQGKFRIQGEHLGFDTQQGRVAAAGMDVQARGEFSAQFGGWRFSGGVDIAAGELLAHSFYTRVGEHPLHLQLTGQLDVGKALTLSSVTFTDPNALRLNGSGRLDWDSRAPIQRLKVELEQIQFPGFYQDYLQPLLAQSGFGELDIQGAVSGAVSVRENQLQGLALRIDKVNVADAKHRLEFTKLGGRLSWRRHGEPTVSELGWEQARVYQIGLGPVQWRLHSVGGNFELLQPTILPVLDGGLQIHQFEAENLLAGEPALLFDAELKPVSLGALTRALGWPEMSGHISGAIPELTLEHGVYRLGGRLTVNVFDGLIQVANLRLERPFGVLPKLVADVEVENLDLERLTSVFTFGKIQGRLGGYVRKLRLLNWQPVHFDAMLATPPGDESEHRISQRAVDTLSSLGGGGASGALSRTFLRIFDDFGYEKLGLSCYLDDNVCLMGGVAPAPNGGYYIVEGSGIPRVDVIGYVERVDWPQLIDQLIATTQGKLPTVGKPDS